MSNGENEQIEISYYVFQAKMFGHWSGLFRQKGYLDAVFGSIEISIIIFSNFRVHQSPLLSARQIAEFWTS